MAAEEQREREGSRNSCDLIISILYKSSVQQRRAVVQLLVLPLPWSTLEPGTAGRNGTGMGPAHSPHPSCSIGCVPEDGQPQAAYPSGLGESLDLPSSGQCKASEQADSCLGQATGADPAPSQVWWRQSSNPGKGWRSFWLRPACPQSLSPPGPEPMGTRQVDKSPCAILPGKKTLGQCSSRHRAGWQESPQHLPRDSSRGRGMAEGHPWSSASRGNPRGHRRCEWFNSNKDTSLLGKGGWGSCSRAGLGNGDSGSGQRYRNPRAGAGVRG